MGSLSENVGMMTRTEYLKENVYPLGNATLVKSSIAIMKDVIYIPILQFVMLIQQQELWKIQQWRNWQDALVVKRLVIF